MEVAGIEPPGERGSTPVNKGNTPHSTEALIKVLTNLTDVDRQMLTHMSKDGGVSVTS